MTIAGFQRWVTHFEDNRAVHAAVDAAIDFDATCSLTAAARAPLVASVQRFQVGESGDGAQLLAKAMAAGDPTYAEAARLFVAEEQQHAALLGDLLTYLNAQPISSHWSDAVFIWLRRLLGLRTELMVLSVAEVVALRYYGALAQRHPDVVVRAVAQRIVDDEHDHVAFQKDRLRAGFANTSRPARLLVAALWWVVATGATVVVAVDHGAVLRTIGYPRRRFVTDVLASFADLCSAVLAEPPAVTP